MAKINYIQINNTKKYIENVAYLTALPVATQDGPDFVSVNNELYVKQTFPDGFGYEKVGIGGNGVECECAVPFIEGDKLVISELGSPNFIDKTFLSVGLYLKRPIKNPKFLVSYAGLSARGKHTMPSMNAKRINKILRYPMPSELTNDNFMDALHGAVKHIFGDWFRTHTQLKKVTFSRPGFKFDPGANVRKDRSLNTVANKGPDYMKTKAYILHNNGNGGVFEINDRGRIESFHVPSSVSRYISGRWLKDDVAMGVITLKLVEDFKEVTVNAEKGTTKWTGNMAKNCIKLMFQLDYTKNQLYVLYTFKVAQL